MKKSMLATMAWRNLWRHRRRTAITLSGIAFGLMLAVVFTGIGDSSYTKMINLAARMGGGHVTLQHPTYQEAPNLKKTITGLDAKLATVSKDPEIVNAVARISGPAMLAAGGNSQGVQFIAFDPTVETTETLSLLEAIDEGQTFETASDKGIILGALLAENLGLKMGRRVVYTMTDKKGEIVNGLARVSGIVKTGSPGVDLGLCLLPIGAVRKALGYASDEATQVAAFISDQRRSEAVSARIRAAIDPDDAAVVPWFIAQPELAGFITMKTSSTTFFEFIIALMVAAGIFNTLLVSVLERMREFGIMMAVGFTPSHLFRLVMWESLFMGLVGLVVAGLVTLGPYLYLNRTGIDTSAMIGESGSEIAGVTMDPVILADIYPEHALYIALAVVIVTLVAGLYPAWKAGRVEPVHAIKLV